MNFQRPPGLLILALLIMMGCGLPDALLEAKSLPRLTVSEPASTGDSGSIKVVTAKVLVNAPSDLVWQTMTNYGQMKNILPGYQKSDVIKAVGSQKIIDIAMKVNPFLPLYHYKAQIRENRDALQIQLERTSGDFKHLKASYQLIPQSERQTLLVYKLAIDPGNNMPGTGAILKTNTEKSCLALQRYLEENNRKTIIGQR